MKTIKVIILILTLCVMNQFTNAQCNGNKVLICRCVNAHCSIKCVSPGQVNHYLANGWGGSCSCCAVRLSEGEISYEAFLSGITPNPVSQSTTISFSLAQSGKVSFKIYDVNGRLISTLADKIFKAGQNELVWNASEVNAGIYFLQFQSEQNLQMEKIMVTK